MISQRTRQLIDERLGAEVGRIAPTGGRPIALVYPSPYAVAMSSLGFQAVYRILSHQPDTTCERAFLPEPSGEGQPLERPVTYESRRELPSFPVIAFSIAYELELAGLIRILQASGIAALSSDRDASSPLILAGGPLTFSNPLPLAPFVDAIVMGEAEQVLPDVVAELGGSLDRQHALDNLSRRPHVFVPARHGDELPPLGVCDRELLPATSAIVTPHTELAGMFLIEVERGCSRGCAYCVMRRSTNGGMRLVSPESILSKIPEDARRVGLVGAAVSDHPRIAHLVRDLARSGREVGLSSLRPDRLSEELVGALAEAGYRTLTTALDGASQRLRDLIERRGREKHYEQAAELGRRFGMERLKLYLMLGLPEETDADIDECVKFVSDLSQRLPVVLGVAPFCAKRRTPLDASPYAGVRTVRDRIDRLRRGLRGRATVRATSSRWAWVEHVLAQGGRAEGLAVLEAVSRGARFSDYRRAFEALGHGSEGEGYREARIPPVHPLH